MSSSTVFTKSVLKTKKPNKIKLLFLVLGRVIKNNPLLFFFCSLLAVITALVNFNVGTNLVNILTSKEKTLSEEVIKEVEKDKSDEKSIKKQKVREILKQKADETNQRQKEVKTKIEAEIEGEGWLEKKKVKKIVEGASIGSRKITNQKDFEFSFNFFG